MLTTTRAPLGIAAERVYQLPQLGLDDAVELFRERATAARPGVRLDRAEVRSLVARLDGLPLAVELAAAKVRAMSVAEIERRLENRFALLRGGSREAPERHQTLLAVIDWSWNLLRRRAAHRAAPALDLPRRLLARRRRRRRRRRRARSRCRPWSTSRSSRSSRATAELRYRLLETVREFGQIQLVGAGDDRETVDAPARLGRGVLPASPRRTSSGPARSRR